MQLTRYNLEPCRFGLDDKMHASFAFCIFQRRPTVVNAASYIVVDRYT